MLPTKDLPTQYSLYRTLDLSKNKPLLVVLNLAGVALFFAFGYLFLRISVLLRPDTTWLSQTFSLVWVIGVIGSYVGVLVLHEIIHGAVFWIITQERPHFGLKQLYAYASAPDWYIPRNPYMAVGLAPLVLISLLGVLLIPVLPASSLVMAVFALTINASGAIGDIITVGWLLTMPATALVCDVGDAFSIYRAIPE